MQRRRLIDDLVEADGGKIRELHLDDGAHPFDGCAHGRADHGVFADRRIDHPPREFTRQVLRGLERAAEFAHILSVDIDARIRGQGTRLRFANGFEVGDHPGDCEYAPSAR